MSNQEDTARKRRRIAGKKKEAKPGPGPDRPSVAELEQRINSDRRCVRGTHVKQHARTHARTRAHAHPHRTGRSYDGHSSHLLPEMNGAVLLFRWRRHANELVTLIEQVEDDDETDERRCVALGVARGGRSNTDRCWLGWRGGGFRL